MTDDVMTMPMRVFLGNHGYSDAIMVLADSLGVDNLASLAFLEAADLEVGRDDDCDAQFIVVEHECCSISHDEYDVLTHDRSTRPTARRLRHVLC